METHLSSSHDGRYHGHVDSMTRADGAYGAFIVDDPESPFKYDEERSVKAPRFRACARPVFCLTLP
eukprot:54408-Eustigmatos_ZCMA.PRE.1